MQNEVSLIKLSAHICSSSPCFLLVSIRHWSFYICKCRCPPLIVCLLICTAWKKTNTMTTLTKDITATCSFMLILVKLFSIW